MLNNNKRNKILIADDSEVNRSLLSVMLNDDFDIIEAKNGLEAVKLINRHRTALSLILLDIVMPEMDGFEVLAFMNNSGHIENIPVIIISAESSSLYIDHAYDLGAVEYVNRPFDEKTVKRRVKNTIMLYSKQKLLENMLTEQMLEKEKTNLIMVEVLSHIVEFRNGESGLHVLHIRAITENLLKRLAKMTDKYDLSPSRISLIANASAMHDIGKISIPESILNKPGPLTAEEYEIVKTHSAAGAGMLESVTYYRSEELIRVAGEICRWHHERYDGAGYPDGLKGEDIPIAAQVVALADVYDALISKRVYKPAFSHRTAAEMIMKGECGVFNPLLLKCLEDAVPFLEKELVLHSAGRTSVLEIKNTVREFMHTGKAENRTLALLEQERTKHLFFASMSKEIQFEYDFQSDLLTISDWGAEQLGISPVILHPRGNESLLAMFSTADFEDLQQRMRDTATPDNPVVVHRYCLNVRGERRWFKAIARPLWVENSGAMTGIIGKFTDIHNEHMELSQLKKMVRLDSLTGLYNKEYARKKIKRILRRGLEEGRSFAVLLIDLDFFKAANDMYGHIFGDKILKEVSKKIMSGVGEGDIASRVGGDEFLIFTEYTEDVTEYARGIFRSLTGKYRNFSINACIGIACAPKDGTDCEELIKRADSALYAAKQSGRGRFYFYDESMDGSLFAEAEEESGEE